MARLPDHLRSRLRSADSLPDPDRCRAIRIASGATQQDLADPLEVTRETVARWENGTRTPRGRHRAEYSELLQELAALVGDSL